MRLNERHAAIAVLFLVVILLVGFFWQDDAADPAQAGADQQLVRLVETAHVPGQVQASDRGDRRGLRGGAPLGGIDEVPGTATRARTPGLQDDAHRVDPGAPALPSRSADLAVTPGSSQLRPSRGGPDGFTGVQVLGGSAASTEMDELAGLAAEAKSQRGFLDQLEPAADQVMAAASAAPAKPLAAPAGIAREYIVRSGDSLSAIATKECGTTSAMDAICRLNGLPNPDIIREGMVLKLPAKTSASPAQVASKAPVAAEGQRTVTIRPGEMLSTVLERELGTYRRSIAAVQQLNPGLDPDRVAVGQSIILPPLDEVPPAAVDAARPRAAASQSPRVASSPNRADRAEYVVR
ncbi:MAG: LysM peptidoglycan-binding domain-containing protein [Planctomycetota bacterium]|nr:LysM peptidoglycan-binding domain-containing protein [Planctomycetota bacterium]MEE2941606.1 LysM peptidoglycan-binding domain-containing protein [Planctomycetota bacterium]